MTETIIQLNGRGNCPNCANPEAQTWEDYTICVRCGSAYKENPVLITSDIETNPPVPNPPEGAKYRRLSIIIERVPVDYGMVVDEMSQAVGDETCWHCAENPSTGFDMLCDECCQKMKVQVLDTWHEITGIKSETQSSIPPNADELDEEAYAEAISHYDDEDDDVLFPNFYDNPEHDDDEPIDYDDIAAMLKWSDDIDNPECDDCGMPIEDCICDPQE